MRDVNRLDNFYESLKKLHKEIFPDWRFLQLMSNFWAWIYSEKGRDPFFYEEDECLELFTEFCKSLK